MQSTLSKKNWLGFAGPVHIKHSFKTVGLNCYVEHRIITFLRGTVIVQRIFNLNEILKNEFYFRLSTERFDI